MASTPPIAVTLENADDVYGYYAEHRQPRLKARFAHFALAAKFRPRVSYADDSRPELAQAVKEQVRLVICINHLADTDQYIAAAAVARSPIRALIGRIRVLAKNDLFDDPRQRANLDMMGCIPVFRARDNDPETAAAASRRMIAVCVERGVGGDSIAVFPEGTRNDADPSTLLPLASGFGQIAVGIAAQAPVAVVPMGIAYRAGTRVGAAVVLGRPRVVSADEAVADVTGALRDRLQHAVDLARARSAH
ncbi:lysophospholipid acyltransferase family protein [Williamsia sp. Leaf354]|uniref:lysophospholipid acyltransferase family protein n=1 Tax=Williamsia sp. Leaf354 TaxID=1736349 RepID=UPI0009EC2277|nr:1-acyl-sn-glycerol-3-phosphate acyltransferase [Williamsia sp. Leaf354]